MSLTNIYSLGMLVIHAGLFWCLRNIAVDARKQKYVSCGLQTFCAVVLGYKIWLVYDVLPALWWPDGVEHFFDRGLDCLGVIALSLVVSVAGWRPKKKSHPVGDVTL